MLDSAKQLVDGQKVKLVSVPKVEYFHIMFPKHEVIWANGMPCESFNPNGDAARHDRDVVSELHALFPDILKSHSARSDVARPVARGFEARLLRS